MVRCIPIKYRLGLWIVIPLLLVTQSTAAQTQQDKLTIGSKNFTEGYILAEILAQLAENAGYRVERRFGLGGTMVCFEALTRGEIDCYPEYSGTLEQAILKLTKKLPYELLQSMLLQERGVELLGTFGFNNTYAIALQAARADSLGLKTIGDLRRYPDLSIAFSHEFVNRRDGWPGLKRVYELSHEPVGIEHGLAYQAIDEGSIDVTDVYSTDGDIRKYGLFLLEDDRHYFPTYLAAPLVRAGLNRKAKDVLDGLVFRITAAEMRALNAEVLLEGKTFAEVAHGFLVSEGVVGEHSGPRTADTRWSALARRTGRHLTLTLIALVASLLVALPAGILVYRRGRAARVVIYVAGALQTVPSIALLAFMIPLFGIGIVPAIVALFLYALLPILRNTVTALTSIDPVLKKVATGMGLTPGQRLRYVELPLSAPTILAGVKTAAVINIGTATLAAFIGAGGLGEPIVTGLALNDTGLILEGAIPAAVLAILTELFFEGTERFLIPRHLQQRPVD